MSSPTSRLSYIDAEEMFDAAIASNKGIRVEFPTEGDAMYYRTRLHTFRQIDRDDNARTYEKGHPMYGCSTFDPIIVRIRMIGGRWYLYLQVNSVKNFVIENLDDVTEEVNGTNSGPEREEDRGGQRVRTEGRGRRV